jgi:hypothetical protein
LAAGLLALSLGVIACGGQGVQAIGAGTGNADDGRSPSDDVDILQSSRTLSAEQFDAAVVTAPETIGHADTSGAAWRMIEVPAAGNAPSIVSTPSGWLALSLRALGDQRAPSAWQSVLYRSRDGVHWQSLPLDPGSDDLQLRDLAYGAGRYVMVGVRTGNEGILWTSSDGEHWTESAQPLTGPDVWRKVVFAGARFFAFGFRYLGVSDTGESWTALPTSLVQGEAAAYGNGRYLLVGSGPMQTSADGREWQEHSLDCSLPGACITDPSGGVAQGYHQHAIFAEGSFFSEELASVDGASWQPQPGRFPAAHVGDRFVGSPSLSTGLAAWTLGGPMQTLRLIRPSRAGLTETGRALTSVGVLDHGAPLPETVDVSFEDGLSCETADCVLVDGRLLLVPPPGTPPLFDRVPRDADGAPLLTDECPVSGMLFCDDYGMRSGCACHAEAPRNPRYCEDVSQYRCAGQFVRRPDEWALDELAQGGCSCDAIDPNQPPGFGSRCTEGDGTCQAPLECLGIDPIPSAGPPPTQPFVCTSRCAVDADCPSWQASGFCSGQVNLRCSGGSCQPRTCD